MKQYDTFNFPGTYCDIAMEYVEYKQSLGFKYSYSEQAEVNRMLNFIYSNSKSDPILALQPELVNAYASKRGNESARTLHIRQSHIRQFALFLNLRGIQAYVYPKELVKTTEDFVPYIFTKDEISWILREADAIGPNKNKFVNTPYIYPAVIRMLYGCGLRVSEALAIKCEHVDLDNGVLVIMNGKNNVSRLVPISESLRQYLSMYDSKVERAGNPYFFPALHNERYSSTTILNQFRKLEEKAGISQLSNGKYPRVHDLRHTFSVHALEQMIHKGMDPYCSLPILSTYLGHKGIESTEKYLRLTKQYFIDILQFSHQDAEKIFPEV
ncbi:Site-specific recombinase XerD [Desulforamulus putei DSM 12395]|uniref:Site-specific recombinase XerD n=1 Tax=Desulforamulus putei DSM 12395 TaxID=1121429 RepID=A0A1M5DHJ0_9FIRM|nr:tyrosine-type recombinase/integrase [Desulforamulus putei]SHF66473.1 Site-specific recombinase XerD [Desulforamulus putei DSM 12395]